MRLLHYAAQPLGPLRSVEQWGDDAGGGGYYKKPRGLWVSVEGDDDWRSLCMSEGFCLDQLTHVHEVQLAPEARILHACDAGGIDRITKRFGSASSTWRIGIDWPAVARDYQGIIIAPYVWARRLDGGAEWYYGWDCASGCVWDTAAVAAVTLVEVVPVPQRETV